MIRTSKHNVSNITNINKLNSLNLLFNDYKICLQYYIDLICNNSLPLKNNLSSKDLPIYNIKHSRYRQLIYKQASEIIRSQLKKANKRRYNKYKFIYKYYLENHNNESKFINLKFSELKLKNILFTKYFTKPTINNITINLDERFFNIKDGNYFDNYIKIILPYFNEKGTKAKQINIPLKQHKHSNKYINDNYFLRKCIQLKQIDNNIFINLTWEKEDKAKRETGDGIGIDLGVNKLIVTSDNQIIGSNLKNIYKKIANKVKNSKSYKRSLTERTNLTNYYINKLNLDNINVICIEELKNVKKDKSFRKLVKKNIKDNNKNSITGGNNNIIDNNKNVINIKNKKLNKGYYLNKVQQTENNEINSRWIYPSVIKKIERICEEKGIYLVKVSPEYTSQTCSKCGKVHKESRNGSNFNCIFCGYEDDADHNASLNIHSKGTYSFFGQERNK